jgi:hypothetical protein
MGELDDLPERWIDEHGYARRATDRSRRDSQLEHRLVMKQFLGGELPAGSHIHHRNRQRHDNALPNLRMMPSEDIHGSLHRAMQTDDLRQVQEIELSCEAWAELYRAYYANGGVGTPPQYSGALRPKTKPILEPQPRAASSGKRRFIVRPRLTEG